MQKIRPSWQAKGLIERVYRLIPVDLSSACQRLLNAAVQDLREKIKVAGTDIAEEVAKQYKLPAVNGDDSIDDYSTAKIIDLAYRMGLLSHAEWRRVSRSYEIRRDLEHEDSEYEAGLEDSYYIFSACITAVLSKDPTEILRVPDVKEVIEAPGPAVADEQLLEDFAHAPAVRQVEILKVLLSVALKEGETELVRSNAFTVLGSLSACSKDSALLDIGRHFQERIGRRNLTVLEMRVAQQARISPYLRKAQKRTYFKEVLNNFERVGYDWRSHAQHGELLRAVTDTGGLATITSDELPSFIKWMTLCYLGEPGGYGAGTARRVFYSNAASPLIEDLFREDPDLVRPILEGLENDKDVKRSRKRSQHVARRFDDLLDLVEPSS